MSWTCGRSKRKAVDDLSSVPVTSFVDFVANLDSSLPFYPARSTNVDQDVSRLEEVGYRHSVACAAFFDACRPQFAMTGGIKATTRRVAMEEQEEKLPSGPPATSNTTIRNVWEESERKFIEQKAKKDRAVGK